MRKNLAMWALFVTLAAGAGVAQAQTCCPGNGCGCCTQTCGQCTSHCSQGTCCKKK